MTQTESIGSSRDSLADIPLGLDQENARQMYALIDQLIYDVSQFPRRKDNAKSILAEMSGIFGPEGQTTFEKILSVVGVDRELTVISPELYAKPETGPAPIANVLRITNNLRDFIDEAMRRKR